ncbi:hypothetical protein EAE99_007760 [Botrytis elliptica]|nr:hypothetical protein EAE99_007760 [Botrytis elliptica]
MESHTRGSNISSHTSRNTSIKLPNIYLIGPQCTGKTTLLETLRTHYAIDANREFESQCAERPVIIEEVVRRVMRCQGFNIQDLRNVERGFELQQCVLLEQYNSEKKVQCEWYISDRSGLDALVYAKAYIGVTAVKKLEDTEEWNRLKKRMQDALVVFCEAGNASWLSEDEVRMKYSNIAAWERLNNEFHAMLIEHHIEYITLPKHVTDLQDRVALIKNALGVKIQDKVDL